MRRLFLIVLALCAILGLGGGAATGEPLRGGETSAAVWVPPGLEGVVQTLNRWQIEATRTLNDGLRGFRDQGTVAAAGWLMLIAFGYGVLHAAGPGHGKMVVGAYFAGNRARALRAVAVALGIALVQAVSAILLVGVLTLLLGMTRVSVLAQVRTVEVVGYGLILGLGLVLLVDAVRGRSGCGHEHPDGAGTHDGHAGCAHHHHGHGHGHAHGDAAPPAGLRLLGLGLAVGLRPCSGALLLLFFSVANDMTGVGVLAVLAMALGVALTTSAAGLIGVGGRQAVLALSAGRRHLAGAAERALRIAGALTVTAAGALLLLTAL